MLISIAAAVAANSCSQVLSPKAAGDKQEFFDAIETYTHQLCAPSAKGPRTTESDELYLASPAPLVRSACLSLSHQTPSRYFVDVNADAAQLEQWWDATLWSVFIDHCFLPIRAEMQLDRREAVVASGSERGVTRKADGYCTSPLLRTGNKVERFFIESARANDDVHCREDFRKISRMQRDALLKRLTQGVLGEVYGIQTVGTHPAVAFVA